ncbi:MAG: hypothetical protein KAQ97_03745 [Candidatus Fermentibacteraceae bacterium]|nr:hypothetical protein [Candidatus Fermentibacteraceae bacterium]
MKKVFLLFCLLAITGTAFAGFSLGYKPVAIPGYVSGAGNVIFADVNLLRVGFAASPEFRLELLAGYDKLTFEIDIEGTSVDADGTVYVIGASGFYVIAAPANTIFSIGLSFLYGKGTGETAGVDDPETSGYAIYPIMRVDFAIPGAERFALFTEFGARYLSTTTDYGDGLEYKFTELSTWGSENILGGAYYSF